MLYAANFRSSYSWTLFLGAFLPVCAIFLPRVYEFSGFCWQTIVSQHYVLPVDSEALPSDTLCWAGEGVELVRVFHDKQRTASVTATGALWNLSIKLSHIFTCLGLLPGFPPLWAYTVSMVEVQSLMVTARSYTALGGQWVMPHISWSIDPGSFLSIL